MSVDVYLDGCGVGNRFFKFFTAAIFAQKNNFTMVTKPDDLMLKLLPFIHEHPIYSTKRKIKSYLITDQNIHTFSPDENTHYMFDSNSFFQNSDYIKQNKKYILNLINIDELDKHRNLHQELIKDEKNVLIKIRAGDFFHSSTKTEMLAPSYYSDILESLDFDHVFVQFWPIDDIHKSKYLQYLHKFNMIDVSSKDDIIYDFYLGNLFKIVITNNSTLHWWSAFFSISDTIYTPKYIGFYEENGHMVKHGDHIVNLCNIDERSIPKEHCFYIENGGTHNSYVSATVSLAIAAVTALVLAIVLTIIIFRK